MRLSWCLFVCPAAMVVAGTVNAEELRDAVIVTASRIPIPLVAAGSSVSVIDREQIEARQSVFAVDLLQDLPGFSVSRSGGIGSQTQVRVRGAEANQVLVLIDGVEANDPAGNDEYAFQDLTTWDVERIEVVRGPQSALWGSDALAGVVNVITRQPTEQFAADGFYEMGAFDTLALGGHLAGGIRGARAGLSLSRIDTDGTNSSRTGNEKDGYTNTTGTLTLAGSPADNLDLEFVGRYSSTSKAFDGTDFSVTGLPHDTADETAVSLGYFRASGALVLAGGRWTQRLRAAWTTTDTENSNEFGPNGATNADKYAVSWQNTWQFTPAAAGSTGDSITLALERERQEFGQRGTATPFGDPNQSQSLDNTAAVLELLLSPLERVSVSLSGRYDNNSDFKTVSTFRGTTSWTTESTGTRLHASFGTGQKAPTFIERFGYFPDQFAGNPGLKPETSTGWEAGVEQTFLNDRINLGATYFHEVLRNEINGFAFDSDALVFTAENLGGRSLRRGVEVLARARVTAGFRVSGSYTYTDATQPDSLTGTDTREIRRPRHAASLNGDLRFLDDKVNVDLNLTYVGDRTDNFFEVAPPFGTRTVGLDSYYLASLVASYQLTGQVRVYARVDNLLNEDYEDVYGYNTPGIGAYAGIRLSFQ